MSLRSRLDAALTRQLLGAVYRGLGLRKSSVMVEGLRIAYAEGGQPHGPPLVLLHGVGADRNNFLAVVPWLRKRFRLLLPDLPGFGESDWPPHIAYDVKSQARRVRGFVRALGIEDFELGGNSMGGYISGIYAALYPEELKSLWLLAPGGVKAAKDSELFQRLDAGEPPPLFARDPAEMRRLWRFASWSAPMPPGFYIRALAAQQRERYDHHLKILDVLLEDPGIDELLADADLQVPTLVTWGAEDRLLHVSGAEVLQQILPVMELQRLEKIGHIPQLEAPKTVAKAFLSFRERHLPELAPKPTTSF